MIWTICLSLVLGPKVWAMELSQAQQDALLAEIKGEFYEVPVLEFLTPLYRATIEDSFENFVESFAARAPGMTPGEFDRQMELAGLLGGAVGQGVIDHFKEEGWARYNELRSQNEEFIRDFTGILTGRWAAVYNITTYLTQVEINWENGHVDRGWFDFDSPQPGGPDTGIDVRLNGEFAQLLRSLGLTVVDDEGSGEPPAGPGGDDSGNNGGTNGGTNGDSNDPIAAIEKDGGVVTGVVIGVAAAIAISLYEFAAKDYFETLRLEGQIGNLYENIFQNIYPQTASELDEEQLKSDMKLLDELESKFAALGGEDERLEAYARVLKKYNEEAKVRADQARNSGGVGGDHPGPFHDSPFPGGGPFDGPGGGNGGLGCVMEDGVCIPIGIPPWQGGGGEGSGGGSPVTSGSPAPPLPPAPPELPTIDPPQGPFIPMMDPF